MNRRAPKKPFDLESAITPFESDARARGLRESTLLKYKVLFQQLRAFAGSKGYRFLKEFTVEVVREFRASWPDQPISALKNAGHGKLGPNACPGQQVPRRPVEYVNTLIGTAPFEDKTYLGNNPPKGEKLCTGAVVPGAMALDGVVKLSPDTGFDGIFHVRGPAYRSPIRRSWGSATRILFIPVTGALKTKPGARDNPGEG